MLASVESHSRHQRCSSQPRLLLAAPWRPHRLLLQTRHYFSRTIRRPSFCPWQLFVLLRMFPVGDPNALILYCPLSRANIKHLLLQLQCASVRPMSLSTHRMTLAPSAEIAAVSGLRDRGCEWVERWVPQHIFYGLFFTNDVRPCLTIFETTRTDPALATNLALSLALIPLCALWISADKYKIGSRLTTRKPLFLFSII